MDIEPEETPEPEEVVIAPEVAEAEFTRFTEAMDLDVDPEGMDDEDKKGFVDAKRKFVKAVVDGHLVVDDDGQPVYTPIVGKGAPLVFREPGGAAFMAQDQKKQGHDMAKLFATMAAMTKMPLARFVKMKGRDIKVCIAVTTLFLG